MKEFWKFTGATIVGLFLFLIIQWMMFVMMLSSLAAAGSSSGTVLKSHSVYEIDLESVINERVSSEDDMMSAFNNAAGRSGEKVYGLDVILSNIKKAKTNDNIEGIYLNGGNANAGFATLQELRNALLDFKESGKFIIAYADNFSEKTYYLSSVADKVCLHPYGSVDWGGLSANIMFYKRVLDKLGVDMQVFKVGTYKSAVEPFILSKMSEANREQINTFLGDMWGEVCSAVSVSRNLTVEELNDMAEKSMAFEEQSALVACGLVDTLLYADDMEGVLTDLCGTDNYKLISYNKMKNVAEVSSKSKDKIAIIYAFGEIYDEGQNGIIGDDMVETINDVAEDKDVKAVVFRVNSPGGSAFASENICQAIKNLRKEGKPVVVSMGDYAASGGYYISSNSDYIIAEPTTLTGSIGIFGLIPNVSKLADKVGVDIDGVSTHTYSSFSTDLVYGKASDAGRAKMQSLINRGYDLFTRRCAEGRDTTQQYIFTIAEGRVWTGKRALELGLVDALGNISDAFAKAAELADLGDSYAVVSYPEEEDFFTKLLKSMDVEARIDKYAAKKLGAAYTVAKELESLSLKPSVEARMEYIPVIE